MEMNAEETRTWGEWKLLVPEEILEIPLNDDAASLLQSEFQAGVDIVLDFLWGEPGLKVLQAATQGRGSRAGEPRVC